MQLETALAVANEPPVEQNLELVALAPSDLLAAQTNLINWCDGKVAAIRQELADFRENLRIAKENKWRTGTLTTAVNRTEKRITFYEKIKAAVAAGYLIVPNFPVDVFAVRVKREKPRSASTTRTWNPRIDATAELLPAGEGRYVGDALKLDDQSYTEKVDGKDKHVSYHVADDFNEVGFPIQAVKPVVLDATQRAMALKIFDSFGLVRNSSEFVNRRGDPIVVGRLIDPRGNGRMVTFFVAWWLNTRDL